MFMKTLFNLLFVLSLAAGINNSHAAEVSYKRPSFFKGNREMHRVLQTALNRISPGSKLERIEQITYAGTQEKSYAFVSYRSDKGIGKMVIQKQLLAGNKVAFSSVYCDGTGCDCQVTTVIGSDGGVKTGCSCSSCTMMVSNIATP